MSSPGLLVVLASLCLLTPVQPEGQRAHDLMLRYPLIDGHNDFAMQLRKVYSNRLSQLDLHNVSELTTDIRRLRAGHVQAQVRALAHLCFHTHPLSTDTDASGQVTGGARLTAASPLSDEMSFPLSPAALCCPSPSQLFAAYVLCGAQQKDAVRLTLEQVDVLRRMCAEYQELELVTSTQELRDSRSRGSIGCLISVEGGHSMDSSLPTLRMFYQLGVRSMTLTHNCNTPWAESSSKLYDVYKRRNSSLTDFGKAVVEEMNRLGMIVDLSHSSWETASSVLQLSRAPVIFSHSSSYHLCPHHRNVPDWLLHKLRDNRGVIMVNLYSNFITCRDEANISHVADHFDHLRRVIGAQFIGIGGDFEGVGRFPKGLEDVSKYPNLIQELLQRGWKEDDLANVLRGNFMRVFEEVERVRDELSSKPPSEEQVPTELVQNPCRMVLRPPDLRPRSLDHGPTSRAHHGPNLLVALNTALLLSSLLNAS